MVNYGVITSLVLLLWSRKEISPLIQVGVVAEVQARILYLLEPARHWQNSTFGVAVVVGNRGGGFLQDDGCRWQNDVLDDGLEGLRLSHNGHRLRWFRLQGHSLRELLTHGLLDRVLHLELVVGHNGSMHARSLVVRSGDLEDAFTVRVDNLVHLLGRGLLLSTSVDHAHQRWSGRLLERVLRRYLQ